MEATTAPAPTRLQVLEHALEIAKAKGAVQNGSRLWERPAWDTDPAWEREEGLAEPSYIEVAKDPEQREAICGVCIAGACELAHIELTGQISDSIWISDLDADAVAVYPDFDADTQPCLAGLFSLAITKFGTPYIVAVLEHAIAQEAATVAAVA